MAQNVSSVDGSPVFTLFETLATDRLEAGHILRLAAGVLGAVRVRAWFTREQCAAIMRGVQRCELTAYDHRLVNPQIAKIGPAAYDFYGEQRLIDEYWAQAKVAASVRATLLDGTDPLALSLAQLRRAWGDEVRAATSRGQEMFAGMIREINAGARMHFDEIVREFTDSIDELPVSQLAFNCHLSTPDEGGESVVFRRRWQPSDEQYRDGYGYAVHLADDQPCACTRAQTGDATLFDPRNYHLVRPTGGGGRRVTLSFFIGLTGRGHLLVWS